jgi:hypothetical protein
MADLAQKLGHDHPGASISVGLAELRAEDTLRDVIRRADTDLYARRAVAAAKPRVGC